MLGGGEGVGEEVKLRTEPLRRAGLSWVKVLV